MKKIVSREKYVLLFIGLLCIIMSILYVWYALSHSTATRTTVNQQPKPEFTLPDLYTSQAPDGSHTVFRSDTHQEVVFKGYISESLRWSTPSFYTAQRDIDVAKKWHANSITYYVNPRVFFNNIKNFDELDTLMEYAKKQHMYVFLQPVLAYGDNFTYANVATDKPREFLDVAEKFVLHIAERYKTYNHIIYGIWTEPHPLTAYNLYREVAQRVIDTVIQINPKALFTVDVSMRNIINVIEQPLVESNRVIYQASYYFGEYRQKSGVPTIEEFKNIISTSRKLTVPFMIIEFGAYTIGDFNSEYDNVFTHEMLKVMHGDNVGYMAYVLDRKHVLRLMDEDENPNTKGKLFIEDMTRYPPTDFSR